MEDSVPPFQDWAKIAGYGKKCEALKAWSEFSGSFEEAKAVSATERMQQPSMVEKLHERWCAVPKDDDEIQEWLNRHLKIEEQQTGLKEFGREIVVALKADLTSRVEKLKPFKFGEKTGVGKRAFQSHALGKSSWRSRRA